jgi:hypothetical protein
MDYSLVVELGDCGGKGQVPDIRFWEVFLILGWYFLDGFFAGDHLFDLR